MRLTDAVFARMVVDIRTLLNVMSPALKADLDGATQFAQSCGGGSASSDLSWGRNPDEADRRFAYRGMMQASRMLRPGCAQTWHGW